MRIAIAVLMSFGLLCAAQAPAAEELPKAKAKFDEQSFDFGTVSQGSKVTHEFPIENIGTADLLIQRIVPACGCTAAAGTQGPIRPGEKGAIRVEFDTSGFSGEKLKTVRIYTNDLDDPSTLLTIKGIVQAEVTVEPASLNFDEIIRGGKEAPEQKLSIRVRPGSKVELGTVKVYSPFVMLKELGGGPKERLYSVSIDPNAPLGELRERIVVAMTGARESAVNVPLFAVVRGQLVLRPAQISFGIIEGTETIGRAVKLDNRGAAPVAVRDVKSSSKALKASFKAIQPGEKYVIQLDLDPKLVRKTLQATVEIVTDSPDEPTVTLSVYGITPPK